jgi:hypothetical protein
MIREHLKDAWRLAPYAVLLAVTLAVDAWVKRIPPKESVTTAQIERVTSSPRKPLLHPLDCAREDDAGRTLKASVWMDNEPIPRCYF